MLLNASNTNCNFSPDWSLYLKNKWKLCNYKSQLDKKKLFLLVLTQNAWTNPVACKWRIHQGTTSSLKKISRRPFDRERKRWRSDGSISGEYGECECAITSQPTLWNAAFVILAVWRRTSSCLKIIRRCLPRPPGNQKPKYICST